MTEKIEVPINPSPCAHCGGEIELREPPSMSPAIEFHCKKCGLVTFSDHWEKEDAIKAFNKRVEVAPSISVEKIKEAMETLNKEQSNDLSYNVAIMVGLELFDRLIKEKEG